MDCKNRKKKFGRVKMNNKKIVGNIFHHQGAVPLFPYSLIPLSPQILFLFSFFLFSLTAFPQQRAAVWYFGDGAGLDFKSGKPEVLTNGVLEAEAGCASICDTSGNLLFYTNGKSVWNKEHQIMANGDTLNASQQINQNSVIVPKPKSDSIYYLFTINTFDSLMGLNYSVVNMNQENGLGRMVEKNIPVTKNVLEKIAAIKHCNNEDYWIITHGFSNSFYVYRLSKDGFNPDTIKSKVGTVPRADIGYLKVSPAANKIVLPVNNQEVIAEIFDFNSRSGKISNPIKIIARQENTYCYGLEFSPGGNMLYVSTGGKKYELLQYNLRNETEEGINSSVFQIATGNNFAMQLAPNGKIYVASENRPYLNAVTKPEEVGEGCDYQTEAVVFENAFSRMGLPNFVQSWFYKAAFDFENTCFRDSTQFTFFQFENIDSVFWSFGDLTKQHLSGGDNFSVKHVYPGIGFYTVELQAYHCGALETAAQQIEIFPYPQPDLVADTGICRNCSVVLDAGEGFDTYLWSSGSHQRFATIYGDGNYFVEVGKDGCFSTANILVWEVEPMAKLPNAFTPNGDGLNDEFKILKPENFVDFHLWIYNRRGEIVFDTHDVNQGWDGTYLGERRYAESFVWQMTYSYLNQYGILVNETEKGMVSIIR